MSGRLQDTSVHFRVSGAVASALVEQAKHAGVSVSEYCRTLVREKVNPAPTVHGRASEGDGNAFAELADQHYRQAANGNEAPVLALDRAVTYARLALCRRGTRQDGINLIFALDQQAAALAQAGYPLAADRAHGEAVALAEYASDDGDEEIGNLVVSAGDNLSPGSLKIARELRETVDGVMGC